MPRAPQSAEWYIAKGYGTNNGAPLAFACRMRLTEAERRLLARLVANRAQFEHELKNGNIEAARGLLTDRLAVVNEAIAGDPDSFRRWRDVLLQTQEWLRQLGETAYGA